MHRTVPALVALLLTGATLVQTQAAPFTFEAATVRSNRDRADMNFIRRQPGGRFDASNMPLQALIAFAYQVQSFQLVDAPRWTADERFDIVAKLNQDPATALAGQNPHAEAMRSLLAERFHLVVRHETRTLDIYALVNARTDGTTGPALKPASDVCARAAREGTLRPPTDATVPLCGSRVGHGRIEVGGMAIRDLLRSLSSLAGRHVIDRTGLTGLWDFELTFAADIRGLPQSPADAPPDAGAPSLFTALQEQLGLKLEASKGPVDVVVVERVQRLEAGELGR